MNNINIDTDTLRRALDGDEEAIKEARALLPAPKPTDPGDVPPGEAWLIGVGGKRFHSIKHRDGGWLVPKAVPSWPPWSDVTLISPLVPARPTNDGEWPGDEPGEANVNTPEPAAQHPEDVPPGEAWLVEVDGSEAIGYRNNPEDSLCWAVLDRFGDPDYLFDDDVTLIARLVPETTEQDDVPEFDPAYVYTDREGERS